MSNQKKFNTKAIELTHDELEYIAGGDTVGGLSGAPSGAPDGASGGSDTIQVLQKLMQSMTQLLKK
jgi:hypothetical protein